MYIQLQVKVVVEFWGTNIQYFNMYAVSYVGIICEVLFLLI